MRGSRFSGETIHIEFELLRCVIASSRAAPNPYSRSSWSRHRLHADSTTSSSILFAAVLRRSPLSIRGCKSGRRFLQIVLAPASRARADAHTYFILEVTAKMRHHRQCQWIEARTACMRAWESKRTHKRSSDKGAHLLSGVCFFDPKHWEVVHLTGAAARRNASGDRGARSQTDHSCKTEGVRQERRSNSVEAWRVHTGQIPHRR